MGSVFSQASAGLLLSMRQTWLYVYECLYTMYVPCVCVCTYMYSIRIHRVVCSATRNWLPICICTLCVSVCMQRRFYMYTHTFTTWLCCVQCGKDMIICRDGNMLPPLISLQLLLVLMAPVCACFILFLTSIHCRIARFFFDALLWCCYQCVFTSCVWCLLLEMFLVHAWMIITDAIVYWYLVLRIRNCILMHWWTPRIRRSSHILPTDLQWTYPTFDRGEYSLTPTSRRPIWYFSNKTLMLCLDSWEQGDILGYTVCINTFQLCFYTHMVFLNTYYVDLR